MQRRVLPLVLTLSMVVTSAALAARGDPQKKLTPADQARAKSMLLRSSDLGPGFAASRDPSESDPYCRALDESDLTLTGESESPNFKRATILVASFAQIYESVADANASWKRGTSPAGERCIRDELGRDGTLVSFRRMSFPRLAQRTIAYRLVGRTQGVKFYLDFIVLQQSRAQAGIAFASAVVPIPKAEQVGLARVVAERTIKAMRGA
jgi:hypothetical protein